MKMVRVFSLALLLSMMLTVPVSAGAISVSSVAGVLSQPFGARSTLILPCTCIASAYPTNFVPQLGRVFITRATGPNSGVYVISLTQVMQQPYKNYSWILPFVWHLGKAQYALPTDCMIQVTLYPVPECIPHPLMIDPTGLSFPKKIQYSGTGFPSLF